MITFHSSTPECLSPKGAQEECGGSSMATTVKFDQEKVDFHFI